MKRAGVVDPRVGGSHPDRVQQPFEEERSDGSADPTARPTIAATMFDVPDE